MNTSQVIKRYYLGLGVIGLIALGIAIFVFVQGASAKQDVTTEKRANEIAEDLNQYISNTATIPKSLDEANIKDVPKTINYTKKSDSQYEFCVTYKSARSYSSGYGLTGLFWGTALRNYSSDNNFDSFSSSYLYLSYQHKKGRNCQTIKPYLSSSSNYIPRSSYTPPRTSSSISGKARDTERQTDIRAMHGQIEAFYAQNGYYPSWIQMNDATWRETNIPGLDSEALRDPQGTGAVLKSFPSYTAYSYASQDSNNRLCDNVASYCTRYKLAATLEDGSVYEKNNLN